MDSEKDRGKVLTPEIDRGKVLTSGKDCKVDRDKILGTNLRFLEQWTKKMKKKKRKNQEIYSKNGIIGQVFHFQK